jgi:hypothetical protein
MLGQPYFELRLGDIFDLSPIPYLAGLGELSDGTAPLPVQWELNVSVTGEPVLAISTKQVIGPERMVKGNRFVEWRLVGKSANDEFTATAEGVILSRLSFSSSEEFTTYFGHFSQMDLRRNGAASPTCLEGLVRNLDFMGMEWSQHGSDKRQDKFHVDVAGRQVYFHNFSHQKRLKDLIEIDRIDRAILGEIHVPIVAGESLEAAMTTLEMIEWFTAFLTMNRTFAPLVRLTDKGGLCGWRIMELGSDPFRHGDIVDNHLIPGGMKGAFEGAFANFLKLDPKLDLRRFIDMMLVMRNQKQLEFMLAGLLLSYEFFTTKFLTDQGKPPPQESNVQQKLNQLNSYLRFIPKAMLDDTLRKDIRNPLFHQGAIVGTDMPTLWDWYTSYLDLLIQIVFVVLGFSGNYISPINNQPTAVPTPAAKK